MTDDRKSDAGINNDLPGEFPKTVVDAVEWLAAVLNDQELADIAALDRDDLVGLHFGLGTYVRNSLQVWSNRPLMEDAGASHEDDVSAVIIEALWRKLREPNAGTDS
jgi:hypothetical protein